MDEINAEITGLELQETVLINGVPFREVDVLDKFGDDGQEIWNNAYQVKMTLAARDAVRLKIAKDVGDNGSILGTVADVSQLNAAAMLSLILALKNTESFAEFQTMFLGAIEDLVPSKDGEPDIYDQAQKFLSSIESREVILTASLKGFGAVITEFATRSTGVANIIIAAGKE